jgi:hypothetical protein
MFIMEMKCTFKTVDTLPTFILQPMHVGGRGAPLHMKGEI